MGRRKLKKKGLYDKDTYVSKNPKWNKEAKKPADDNGEKQTVAETE